MRQSRAMLAHVFSRSVSSQFENLCSPGIDNVVFAYHRWNRLDGAIPSHVSVKCLPLLCFAIIEHVVSCLLSGCLFCCSRASPSRYRVSSPPVVVFARPVVLSCRVRDSVPKMSTQVCVCFPLPPYRDLVWWGKLAW